jgi:hypothetical protein
MSVPIRSIIRLSSTERIELLHAIAMRSDAQPETARRKDPRFTLPDTALIVGELCQPGGTPQRAVIAGRDIGRGGMGFFHNCFLHPGTICRFAFADADRKAVCERSGVVRRCEHVRGMVHDVGVQFDEPMPIAGLMRIINRAGDPCATCKYPALLSLTQELVELVRNGTPLPQVLGVMEELTENLRAQMPPDAHGRGEDSTPDSRAA